MTRFIVMRLLTIVPIMFGVSFFVFILAHLAPGDVTTTLTGPYATEETREQIRESLGLNEPLPVQYGKWLSHILQGEFGKSIANRRMVAELIFPKFANSAILALTSAATGLRHRALCRHLRGVQALRLFRPIYHRGHPHVRQHSALLVRAAAGAAVLADLAMAAGDGHDQDIVGGGGPIDVILHLILPTIAAGAAPAAIIARTVRATMLEILSQNYIKVARAKGIRRGVILRKHALRNALPPIATICGLQLGYLLGGVLFVEVIFAWPGIGYQLWQAIQARDIPTIQGASLIIAVAFVLVNLAVDVFNAYTDPKIRISEGVRSR